MSTTPDLSDQIPAPPEPRFIPPPTVASPAPPEPDAPPVRAEDAVSMLVYRPVSVIREHVPGRGPVDVALCEVKRLWTTDETRMFNTGTERIETYLLLDAQGRVYHHRPGMGFANGSSYVRDGEPTAVQFHFTNQLPVYARDIAGRPLSYDLPPLRVRQADAPGHR